MIIVCTYEKDTDIGSFDSTAKLNTQTGEVFDIRKSKRNDEGNINEVLVKKVRFIFHEVEYRADVTGTDDNYTIKDSTEFKTILVIQRNQKIDSLLEEKAENHIKKKI